MWLTHRFMGISLLYCICGTWIVCSWAPFHFLIGSRWSHHIVAIEGAFNGDRVCSCYALKGYQCYRFVVRFDCKGAYIQICMQMFTYWEDWQKLILYVTGWLSCVKMFTALQVILTWRMPRDTPNSIIGHIDLLLSGEYDLWCCLVCLLASFRSVWPPSNSWCIKYFLTGYLWMIRERCWPLIISIRWPGRCKMSYVLKTASILKLKI